MCKYRKNILDGELSEYMKRICLKISENANFEIETVETDKNHIHFMITYSPSVSVPAIVRKLKQETTYTIWKDFPNLHKVYWKEKTFCANSFQRLKTFGFSWHYYIKRKRSASYVPLLCLQSTHLIFQFVNIIECLEHRLVPSLLSLIYRLQVHQALC